MTASVTHSRHRYTYDAYLTFERDSEMKHEFADGEIYAMAGGSLRHSALASRISAALESARASDRVEIYRRLSSGSWEYRDVREGVVTLASGATLDHSILYADLPP